jgi:signal transduction histidine kinase
VLAGERSALRQRELLLHGALEASPAAVLLLGASERVIYANRAARLLFGAGRRLDGWALEHLLEACPDALRAALETERDALATVAMAEGDETFQISQRLFEINARRQRLIQVRRLTAELRRQEVAGWKKAIRVVSHEVRSNLAPIRSLTRSARTLGARGEAARVEELLGDIDQSAASLQRFIEGYGRFARLPDPRLETVALRGFLDHLRRVEPFALEGEPPALALRVDPGQLQLVLVNLLKNAREAGGPADAISIVATADANAVTLEVRDRGCGMDEAALEKATLPFHSTKSDGTGLGLALCREILEAHGGSLRLAPRDGGGLVAACRLPLADDDVDIG